MSIQKKRRRLRIVSEAKSGLMSAREQSGTLSIRLILFVWLGVMTALQAEPDISDLNGSQIDLLKPDFIPGEHNDTNVTDKNVQKQQHLYESAAEAFRNGSYYEAIDALASLVKNPDSPFFAPSLLLSGKTYLRVGNKTGIKKYLWTAAAYLNLYLAKVKSPEWEYFYTKGMVYENLGFPERAEVYYKTAIEKAKTKRDTASALIGLMRIAVWKKRLDLPTKYLILENVEMLKSGAADEYDFIKGMEWFLKKDYARALKHFQKTYRKNEHYLIDNPNYYLIVAESAYRDGQFRVAEHFFRRIIAVVKSRDVIQKAMMRMGDIAWRQQHMKSAANFYYLVAKKFSRSDLATVAKLKLIHLIESPSIKEKLIELDEEAFKDPERFVALSLVKNRTNFIGRYALANFGESVLRLHSDKLDERLAWELSLIGPSRLDYEQKEYIAALWRPYLKQLDAKRICRLYLANEGFFQTVFDQNILITISSALGECDSNAARLRLLEYIVQRWESDDNRYRLAQFLYQERKYADSLEALQHLKRKECRYGKLAAQDAILMEKPYDLYIDIVKRYCDTSDETAQLLMAYRALEHDDVERAATFAVTHNAMLAERYDKQRVGYRFVHRLLTQLVRQSAYERAYDILIPLTANIKDNCFLNSLILLSSIRTGNVDNIAEQYKQIADCKNDWAAVARTVYGTYRLSETASQKE
jgi:TolA-binding protein